MTPEYLPVNGKTYSLFGKSDSTSGYYETIRMLTDKILALNPDTRDLIDNIRKFSSKKRILKKMLKIEDSGSLMAVILNLPIVFMRPNSLRQIERSP
jgi:hypothetical protein